MCECDNFHENVKGRKDETHVKYLSKPMCSRLKSSVQCTYKSGLIVLWLHGKFKRNKSQKNISWPQPICEIYG